MISKDRYENSKALEFLKMKLSGCAESVAANAGLSMRNAADGNTILDSSPVVVDCSAFFVGCNISCPRCFVRENAQPKLPIIALYSRMWEFLRNALHILECPDGEPFLEPYLDELIDATSTDIPKLSFTSNGILLNRKNRDMCLNRVRTTSVTLDSVDPELYDRLHGAPGHLEKILDNLRSLSELKKETGAKFPEIYVNHVIQKENIGGFGVFHKAIAETGPDGIWLLNLVENQKTTQIHRKHGDFDYDYSEQMLEPGEFEKSISGFGLHSSPIVYEPINTITTHIISPQFLEMDGPLCCVPWMYVSLHSSGAMKHCCFGKGEGFAGWWDTGKTDVMDLWNHPFERTIRKQITEYGISHHCINTNDCPIVRKLRLLMHEDGKPGLLDEVRRDFSGAEALRPYIREIARETLRRNAWWFYKGKKVLIADTPV